VFKQKLILNSVHSFYTICVNYPANTTLVCVSLDIKSDVCLCDGTVDSPGIMHDDTYWSFWGAILKVSQESVYHGPPKVHYKEKYVGNLRKFSASSTLKLCKFLTLQSMLLVKRVF